MLKLFVCTGMQAETEGGSPETALRGGGAGRGRMCHFPLGSL